MATTREVRFDNTGGQPFVEGPTVPETRSSIVDGIGDERMPPGTVYDALYLSEDDKNDFGIPGAVLSSQVDAVFGRTALRGNVEVDLNAELKGDRVVMMARDPGEFKGKEVDRIRMLKRKWRSLEVVRDPKSQANIGHMDGLYVTVSREEYEQRLRAHNAECDVFKKQLDTKKIGTKDGEVQGFDKANPDVMEAEYQRTHNLLQQPAMGAGQYPGMTYSEIVGHIGADKVLETEMSAASGGRPVDPAKYREFLSEQSKNRVSRSKNRKYSFPGAATR